MPDYLLVHKDVKRKLTDLIIKNIIRNQGKNPEKSDAYTRIINQRHFDGIVALINKDKLLYGGIINKKEKYGSPTILDNIVFDDRVMQEEIFGPVLPVIEFDDIDKLIVELKGRSKGRF